MWANPFLMGVPYPPLFASNTRGFNILPTNPHPALEAHMRGGLPLFPRQIQVPTAHTVTQSHPVGTTLGFPPHALLPPNAWNVTYISPYTPLSLGSTNGSALSEENATPNDAIPRTGQTNRSPLSAIDMELAKINNAMGLGTQRDIEANRRAIHTADSLYFGKSEDTIPMKGSGHQVSPRNPKGEMRRVQSPPMLGNGFLIPSPKAASTPLKPANKAQICSSARKPEVHVTPTQKLAREKALKDSNSDPSAQGENQPEPNCEPLDLRVRKDHSKRSRNEGDSKSDLQNIHSPKRFKIDPLSDEENILTFVPAKKEVKRRQKATSGRLKCKQSADDWIVTNPKAQSIGASRNELCRLTPNKENVVNSQELFDKRAFDITGEQQYHQSMIYPAAKSEYFEQTSTSAINITSDSGIAQNSAFNSEQFASYLKTNSAIEVGLSVREQSTTEDSGLGRFPSEQGKADFENQQPKTIIPGSLKESVNGFKSGAISDCLQGIYKCRYPNCTGVYSQMKLLNFHYRNVHGEKCFKCPFEGCDKSYATRSTLRHHEFVHTDTFKCTWPNCGKRFRDDYNLRTHHMIHTGKKPRQCQLCEYACVQKNSMDWHMKTKHSE